MTDAEVIENLRASAQVTRQLRALGHVTIRGEPKPPRWLPNDLSASKFRRCCSPAPTR
jgi:hypothetical protein